MQTRKYFQERSLGHIFDVICRPHLSKYIFKVTSNWYHVRKFVKYRLTRNLEIQMCKFFKLCDVKMIILNLWSECQNLVWKFQANSNLNAHEVWDFYKVEYMPLLLTWREVTGFIKLMLDVTSLKLILLKPVPVIPALFHQESWKWSNGDQVATGKGKSL